MSEIDIDKDCLFDHILSGIVVKPKPKSYSEAFEGFRSAETSWHELAGRARYLHGKAAYLLRMIALNSNRAKDDILKIMIPNFQYYDPLTQFYIIQEIGSLHLGEAWNFLAEFYYSTQSWRLQSISLWVLVDFADEQRRGNELRIIIDRALRTSPYLKSSDMAAYSIVHYLQFSSAAHLSDILSLYQRESAYFSEDAKKLYANILYKASSEIILPHLTKVSDPGLLGPMLEALYLQSNTVEPLPTFATELLGDRNMLSDYMPTGETSIKDLFIYLMAARIPPQQRGRLLEIILANLFNQSGFKAITPFTYHGEQVDGLLEFDRHQYLIEAKWTKKKVSASTVYAFRGKVEGRLIGTRGLFVSISTSSYTPAFLDSSRPVSVFIGFGMWLPHQISKIIEIDKPTKDLSSIFALQVR